MSAFVLMLKQDNKNLFFSLFGEMIDQFGSRENCFLKKNNLNWCVFNKQIAQIWRLMVRFEMGIKISRKIKKNFIKKLRKKKFDISKKIKLQKKIKVIKWKPWYWFY